MPELKTIPIEKIKVPEVRVGSVLDEDQRALLAATVKAVGVIQDPVVRPLGDGNFELIAGRSRIAELAAQGATSVQVKVIEADEKLALIMNIVENVARGSYDYISISQAIRKLRAMGSTPEELEKIFPWKKRWIEFLEGIQDLPADVIDAVRTRKLTPTHVQLALELPTPYEVHDGLKTAASLGWDTGTFKVFVQNRVDQISRARKDAESLGQEPVIPPSVPQDLVNYTQCLVCGYKKPREKVMVSQVCEDCKEIAGYVAANLGSDPGVMHTLCAALQAYFGTPPGDPYPPKPPTGGGAQG